MSQALCTLYHGTSEAKDRKLDFAGAAHDVSNCSDTSTAFSRKYLLQLSFLIVWLVRLRCSRSCAFCRRL